ncbi:MAG: DUF1501 domain-containing protein [Acidimicrobiales bacterium]|nr:DUF1501 domain-containing protein [Acidimicrobiales bacterium]
MSTASAAARIQTGNGRLVVVYLRGGADHLSMVVPYTDPNYYAARPTIAVDAAEVLPLDAQFGFHPVMTGLHALYGANRLAVVVGAGNPTGDRSHFVAQDLSEYATAQLQDASTGWLGRYLNDTTGSSIFRALTVDNNVSLSLRGFPALGIASLANFGIGGLTGFNAGYDGALAATYYGSEPIESTGTAALNAAAAVSNVPSTIVDPGLQPFADAAALLDANLGIEVMTINLGGWDTHEGMGVTATGQMRNLLEGLDSYLAGFQADLDGRGLTDVTTVVVTEFGRRVAENGSGGTDHGWASAMLVMGGAANGGVYGTLPALTPAAIGARGDVPVSVDFRHVLGYLAGTVLGHPTPGALFPNFTYSPLGVVS